MKKYQNMHFLRSPRSKEIYDELIFIKEHLVHDQTAEKYIFFDHITFCNNSSLRILKIIIVIVYNFYILFRDNLENEAKELSSEIQTQKYLL